MIHGFYSFFFTLFAVYSFSLGIYALEVSNEEAIKKEASIKTYFIESFDKGWQDRWTISTHPKYRGIWQVRNGIEPQGISGDQVLVMSEKAKHYGISTTFESSLELQHSSLVIQYEVRLEKGLDCGGAYLKLISFDEHLDLANFSNDTPYTIMFGPDKCGIDNRVQFVFRHFNPMSNSYEEKKMKGRVVIKQDNLTHLYTLSINPDNSFQIYIDQEMVREGNLLEDFEPSVIPPKEIDDPIDSMPADWETEEKIPDTEAEKPEDWDDNAPTMIRDNHAKKPVEWNEDEPTQIPDPKFMKPSSWIDEEDGEWIAPMIENPVCWEKGCGKWEPKMIPNPNYRGKWQPPLIDNPKYQGPWEPRQIPNPNYFEDLHPSKFNKMSGVGFDIWTMTDGISFDNILITNDIELANNYATKTWKIKNSIQKRHLLTQVTKEGYSFFDINAHVEDFIVFAGQNPTVIMGTFFIGIILPTLILLFIPNGWLSTTPHLALVNSPAPKPKSQ